MALYELSLPAGFLCPERKAAANSRQKAIPIPLCLLQLC
jgi:hypothetical protein